LHHYTLMKFSVIAKIFTILSILLILTYLGFVIWKYSYADGAKLCTSMEVIMKDDRSIRFISENEIARILDHNNLNPIGAKLIHISTEQIEKKLLENELIKQVECYKTNSGKLVVEVTQRTPKYLIAGNQSYYVDTDRRFMPVSMNYAAYVPVVSGRVLRAMAVNEIFDFVSFLEKDTFWNAQIEQIYIREDLKAELIPRVGNSVIVLGSFDNFENKLRNLKALYTQGFTQLGWNRYDKIDLQYKGQIVCTKTGTKPEVVLKPDTTTVKDSIVKKI
jgi:cell division protein FtsQ